MNDKPLVHFLPGQSFPREQEARPIPPISLMVYTVICCGPLKPAVMVPGAADSDARCLSRNTLSLCWNDVSTREKAADSLRTSGWQRLDTWRWACPDCAEASSPPG